MANSERALLLSSTLESLDATSREDAGAFKFLLHSSGAAAGIDVAGHREKPLYTGGKGKGKAKATLPAPEDDPALDVAVSQVLDVFPDQDPQYLRHLLAYPDYPFKGNAERLIEALLEGTAPSPEDAAAAQLTQSDDLQSPPIENEYRFTQDRRNIFDDEEMDLSRVRTGKKAESSSEFLQDRAFMSEMKSSILQRAEAAAYDFDDDDDQPHYSAHKGRDVAFEDDEDDVDEGSVVYVRDGGESQEEGNSDDDSEEDRVKETSKDPNTILELAYLRDPKLFANDAQTRRSKERADLKAQTGWSDEQIQGWKVMLERNPHKDRILQKHEFSGNQRGMVVNPIPSGSQSQDNRGRGRGRGRGNRGQDRGRGGGGRGGGDRGRGGGGRGRGGGHHGEGGPSDETSKERAWKDKNKARQANHDRKRGHDKKMSRMGGPS
ncbi:hypothetical protein NLI96_g4753 [Meripilus lineatus]|uniref:CUE domain-containing protein n=1 Tax=Meripilus lineatus TaxID=2056292 RepID=A0AAD5YEI0_9APHY|nr:hypothetical protein NLI96_g4753 [Physisporinus lineatus]